MSFNTRSLNHSADNNKGENYAKNVNTIASYRKSRNETPQYFNPKPLPNFLDRFKRDDNKFKKDIHRKLTSNKENNNNNNNNPSSIVLLKRIKELENENEGLRKSIQKISEENKFLKDEIVLLNQWDSNLSPNVSSSGSTQSETQDYCNILNIVKEMDKESLEKLIVEVYVRLEELKDAKS